MHVLSAPDISGWLDPQFTDFLKTVVLDMEDHLKETMTWKGMLQRYVRQRVAH